MLELLKKLVKGPWNKAWIFFRTFDSVSFAWTGLAIGKNGGMITIKDFSDKVGQLEAIE